MNVLIQLVVTLVLLAIWFTILYFVVKAAISAAMERQRLAVGNANQLLAAQADLTARLAKHLMAQTDLMVMQARHDGMTEEQLAPVLAQVEERRADPALSLPFA
jgi:hypothetical protein